ncbi:uncharacterized protein LOC119583627, partial [Penaeus monodon]|uniref:uncharacterized protein LOC119583627 n=1 Tax=Penaeus monodon TaxID=6687 RepID=UPI0018A6E493
APPLRGSTNSRVSAGKRSHSYSVKIKPLQFCEQASPPRKRAGGRKKKLTPGERQKLIQLARANQNVSSEVLRKLFIQQMHMDISSRTIRRELIQAGMQKFRSSNASKSPWQGGTGSMSPQLAGDARGCGVLTWAPNAASDSGCDNGNARFSY